MWRGGVVAANAARSSRENDGEKKKKKITSGVCSSVRE